MDQQTLRELFYYEDGRLFWRVRPHSRSAVKPGDEVGYLHPTGYRSTKLRGKFLKVHRLIWVLCHGGSIPEDLVIDHINGIRDDNRIENLQLVTPRQNVHKGRLVTQKTSGLPIGVTYRKGWVKPFHASIHVNRHRHHIGSFATLEEAATARDNFFSRVDCKHTNSDSPA